MPPLTIKVLRAILSKTFFVVTAPQFDPLSKIKPEHEAWRVKVKSFKGLLDHATHNDFNCIKVKNSN